MQDCVADCCVNVSGDPGSIESVSEAIAESPARAEVGLQYCFKIDLIFDRDPEYSAVLFVESCKEISGHVEVPGGVVGFNEPGEPP